MDALLRWRKTSYRKDIVHVLLILCGLALAMRAGYSATSGNWPIIGAILGSGLAYLLARHPVIAIAGIVFVGTNGGSRYDLPTGIPLLDSPLDILYLALLWSLGHYIFVERRSVPRFSPYVPWIVMLFLMVTSGVGVGSPFAEPDLLQWSIGLILCAAMVTFVRQERQLKWLVVVMLLAAAVFLGRHLYGIVISLDVARYQVVGLLRVREAEERASLWLAKVNNTGWYMNLLIAFCLPLVLNARERKLRVLSLVVLIGAVILGVLSTSRGGFFGGLLALIAVPVISMRSKEFRQQMALSILIVVVALYIGWTVFSNMPQSAWMLERLADTIAWGSSTRIPLYREALAYIARSPIIGHGADTKGWHSFFLTMLSRYGVMGLTITLLLFLTYLRESKRAMLGSRSGLMRGVTLGSMAALVVAIAQSIGDSTFHGGEQWVPTFFLMRGFEGVLQHLDQKPVSLREASSRSTLG